MRAQNAPSRRRPRSKGTARREPRRIAVPLPGPCRMRSHYALRDGSGGLLHNALCDCCFSCDEAVAGPRRPGRATSLTRNRRSARGQRSNACLRDRQTSHVSQRPALLRHPPARARTRHPDRAGAAEPPGRFDDDDLHARPAPWRPWSSQSPRHAMSRITRQTPATSQARQANARRQKRDL